MHGLLKIMGTGKQNMWENNVEAEIVFITKGEQTHICT